MISLIRCMNKLDIISEDKKFYIHKDMYTPEAVEYDLNKLHNFLLVNKFTGHYFTLNNLIESNGGRKTENFDVNPNVIFLDLDFHNGKDTANFKTEYKNFNATKTLEENIEQFKVDFSKYAYISANSKSGQGLRFICIVLYNTADGEIDRLTMKERHRSNYDLVLQKLEEVTGLKTIDKSMRKNVTQGTNLCRKKDSIVYTNPFVFNNTQVFNHRIIKDELSNVSTREYTSTEVMVLNADIMSQVNYKKLSESHALTASLQSREHCVSLLMALSGVKDLKVIKMFYTLFKSNYKGKSIPLQSLEAFTNYISVDKRHWLPIPLEDVLLNYGIGLDFSKKETDVFGRKYDKIVKFKNYIGEYQKSIDDMLLDKLTKKIDRIVIKAPTGSGKTTAILKAMNKVKGLKLFVTPTNTLADQTVANAKKNKIKVASFFNGNYEYELLIGDAIIITNLSNLKKLSKLKIRMKVSVFDECQNIVNYSIFSEEQWNFPQTDKQIYLSATPEQLLTGLSDMYYFNFKKLKTKKKNINLVPCKSVNSVWNTLDKMLNGIKDTDKIMVFINSKDKAERIKKMYPKFKFQLINSKNKNADYKKLMSDEKLINNIIATSLINDGVNIKNEKWDKVIIVDNHTQSFLETYQFTSRFRIANPDIYYIFRYANNGDDARSNRIDFDDIEYMYRKERKDLIDVTENINANFVDSTDGKHMIKLGHIYYDEKDNCYKTNKNRIKRDIHQGIMEDVRNNYKSFILHLSYFFNIKLKAFQTDEGNYKVNTNKEVLAFFIENRYHVLGNIEISTLFDDSVEINDYILRNKSRLSMLVDRYNELEDVYEYTAEKYKTDFYDIINKPESYYTKSLNLLAAKVSLDKLEVQLKAPDKMIKYNLELIKKIINGTDIYRKSKVADWIKFDDFLETYKKNKQTHYKSDFELRKVITKVLGFSVNRTKDENRKNIYEIKLQKKK